MIKVIRSASLAMLLLSIQISFALAADQVYFYATDPAGTPLVMTDATGTVVWRADYMPFGEETVDQATVQNNKMFVGKEKDSESGLYNFGPRSEDSLIGRFTSPDPIGPIDPRTGQVNQRILHNPQRLNLYTYGLNNPYRYVDADGRMATEIGAGIGTLVAPGPGTLIGAGSGFLIDLGASVLAGYGIYKAGEAIYNASNESDTNKENVGKSGQDEKTKVARPEGYWDAESGAREWGKRNGVGAREGKNRFHRGVKQGYKGRASDDFSVNPETGDVLDPNGESAGNLNDVRTK